MKPDPSRAEALFLAAAEIAEPQERAAFLDRECGDDLALRARVDGLLASHDEAGDFLQPAAPSPELEAEFARLKPEEAGERIGHYKLLQQIGEGGFGVVWMAEQVQPVRRRVALKIIKMGMDTKEVIARFEQERQALAMMDHPNIAKVFDAGATPFGRPYFVMELVRGIKITDYCDQASLPTAERLQLFIAVCQAVQHAHQKGIIHRDLKPSNVMVTLHDGVPVPKVIDFGVAKAIHGPLTDKTLFTHFEQMLGTPLYMSPEQAELSGLDIDTRSDIYSLGVLLYELLTGRTPVDAETLRRAGLDEIRRLIREEEPPRPSTALRTMARDALTGTARHRAAEPPSLIHAVSGDLDWIAMKAIEKDRKRRYETANGLAMDVQRHLEHEPVLARPPSAAYRFRKMVQRNKLTFTASAAVAAALIVGVGVSTWQAIRASRAENAQAVLREKAEANERKAFAETARATQAERAAKIAEGKAVEEKEATRQALAKAELALAEAAFREHDGVAMRAALDRVPEDLRESNWNYLLEHADTSLATLRVSKSGEVAAAAAHPKKAGVFAITNAHGYVALVEARTGTRLLEFRAGLKIVTTSSSDTRTESMAFSPDGGRLAIGQTGPGLVIHSALDGRKLVEWDAPRTTRLQFSPDGRQLLQVCGEEEQINLWEAATGQLVWTYKASAPAAPKAAFTPGGQTIAFCSTTDKLRLLNVKDGSLNREFPNRGPIVSIAMHRDGRRMFTAEAGGYVSGWDLRDGSRLFETRIIGLALKEVVFTDDGARFVTLSVPEVGKQSIEVWDATSGVHLQTLLGGSASAWRLFLHPLSGELLVSGPVAKSWSLAIPPAKWRFLVNSFELAFWGAEDLLLTSVGLLDLAAGTPAAPPVLWKAEGGGNRNEQNLTVSGDGRIAAIGRLRTAAGVSDINIQLLQRAGQTVEAARVLTFRGGLRAMRLNSSGDRLAVFTKTGNVIVEPATGAERARLEMNGIGFAKDAVWVDGDTRLVGLVTAKKERGFPGAEEQIVLWDAATGQRLQTVPTPTPGNRLVVSPDGRTIAEAGEDKMVRLRDARTLAIKQQFRAHDAAITALAWHPTRAILATGSEDLTVKLWDLETLKLIEELRGPEATVRSVAFSPTGRRLACLTMTPRAYVWEPESLSAK